jgi:hypothetical protein
MPLRLLRFGLTVFTTPPFRGHLAGGRRQRKAALCPSISDSIPTARSYLCSLQERRWRSPHLYAETWKRVVTGLILSAATDYTSASLLAMALPFTRVKSTVTRSRSALMAVLACYYTDLLPYASRSKRLTNRWSEPLTRHGESSTGFDFMKQFQQLATAYPPRRVRGRSASSR